jgi:hypothetical protein
VTLPFCLLKASARLAELRRRKILNVGGDKQLLPDGSFKPPLRSPP